MCEPTTIALAITAAASAASMAAQSKNVDAQNKANKVNRDNAVTARNANLSQIEVQKAQATEQASQKMFENDMAGQKALSTARTSAGENGVTGVSVDSLLAELDGSRSKYNDSVTANLQDNVTAMNQQRENVNTGAVNAVGSLKTPAIPDYLGQSLRIAGAAYETSNKPKKETP